MKSNGTKFLIVILIILILVAGGIMAYKIIKDKENKDNFKIAFKKVQAIIDRNKNYFERLS